MDILRYSTLLLVPVTSLVVVLDHSLAARPRPTSYLIKAKNVNLFIART